MTSDRVRRLVILVVLAVWTVVVGAYLWQGKLPDAPILGIPGGVYLMLYPPRLGGREEPAAEPPPAPPAPPAQPPTGAAP